jgi:hypothetical protein
MILFDVDYIVDVYGAAVSISFPYDNLPLTMLIVVGVVVVVVVEDIDAKK